MPEALNEQLLDERLAQLEKARTWSPRLISKLEGHIRSGTDEALFRINPFTFAREKNAPGNEVIDLFLHATVLGLFRMDWALFCPQCCCVVESLRSLKGVHNHYHCGFCQIDYETALDDYVAVSFTISPEIRDIAFHQPGQLSRLGQFHQGRQHARRRAARRHGLHRCQGDPRQGHQLPAAGRDDAARVRCRREAPSWAPAPRARSALLFSVAGRAGHGAADCPPLRYEKEVLAHTTGEVAPGRIIFEVENVTAERGIIVVAVVPPGVDIGGHSHQLRALPRPASGCSPPRPSASCSAPR